MCPENESSQSTGTATDADMPESVLPEQAPPAERSLELPAVIIGDRGDASQRPKARVLPGRLPESVALYPAYTMVGGAALLTTHYALNSGEWSPLMTFVGWGLLFCWYWVYGVAYRYRRRIMKWFSLLMSTATAATLTVATAVRSTSMAVPVDGTLSVRSAQPLLFGAAALTTLSLALIITHVAYLGRGYRQKAVDDDNGLSNGSVT